MKRRVSDRVDCVTRAPLTNNKLCGRFEAPAGTHVQQSVVVSVTDDVDRGSVVRQGGGHVLCHRRRPLPPERSQGQPQGWVALRVLDVEVQEAGVQDELEHCLVLALHSQVEGCAAENLQVGLLFVVEVENSGVCFLIF